MQRTPRLSRLRRPIDPARHVAEIDGLRMLAIGVVVIGHILAFAAPLTAHVAGMPVSADPLRWIRGEGLSGVMLFFAISGFVLMLPFARAAADGAAPSIRAYFRRRLTRLEPPYLLTLFVLYPLLILLDGWAAGDLGWHLLAGLPYAHVLIFGTRNPINPVTWSLEVEVQFYLVMPLLAWGLLRLGATARRAVLAAVIVAMPIAQQATGAFAAPRIGMSLIGSLQFFAIGILAADLFTAAPATERGSSRWDLAFLLGLVPFLLIEGAVPGGLPPTLTPACALLVFGALRGRRIRSVLRTPWIVVVGGMCYSLYLVHYQLVRGLWRWTRTLVTPALGVMPNLLVQVAILLTMVLLVSGLFFVTIERPCMRRDWPERALARWRAWRVPRSLLPAEDVHLDRRAPAVLES